MGIVPPSAVATPSTSGVGAPSASAINGSRYTQLDGNGNAVAEWLRAGGVWTLLYDTQDVIITSAEFPSRPTAGSVLDRTIYVDLSTKAVSVTSGGVWIENVGGGGGGGGAPSGAAGGDLAGTYPNPTVKSSVSLTGTPTAPTAAGGTNTTQIATTSFVTSAVAGVGGGSLSSKSVLPTHLSDVVRLGAFQPTGTLVTNIRDRNTIGSQTLAVTSGTMRVATSPDAVVPAGTTITNLNIITTNAGTGPFTNQWMCILDDTMTVVATTQDRTSTTFTTNTVKTYRIASTIGGSTAGSWTAPATMGIYVGLAIVGGTPPSVYGLTLSSVTAAVAPAITGSSTTGLTDPASLPSTPSGPTGGGAAFWWWAT